MSRSAGVSVGSFNVLIAILVVEDGFVGDVGAAATPRLGIVGPHTSRRWALDANRGEVALIVVDRLGALGVKRLNVGKLFDSHFLARPRRRALRCVSIAHVEPPG